MDTKQIEIDSGKPFQKYLLTWKLMGFNFGDSTVFRFFYRFIFVVVFAVGFPLHLFIELLYCETQRDIFTNLIITTASISCLLKHFAFWWKIKVIIEIIEAFKQLDKRIQDADERAYMSGVIKQSLKIVNTFFVLYQTLVVFIVFGIVFSKERNLIYPGWFPFDWHATFSNYFYAAFYQLLGLQAAIIQNLANDIYAGVLLCMFAGHMHVLRLRLAKVGNDNSKTKAENNASLIDCIHDYTKLMKVYSLSQEVLSLPMLLQFLISGANIGLSVIVVMFYRESFARDAYHTLQLGAIFGELLPFCYYGTMTEREFDELPYAIFCSNWIEQDRAFRRNVVLFTEFASRGITMKAGGMIRINLDAFFATCKMAYSLFTLILNMK